MSSNAPCHLCCFSGPFRTLYLSQQKKEEESITFLICSSCGLIFREFFPTGKDLEEYYRNSWRGLEENSTFWEKSLATAQPFLDQLSKYSRPGRFLDVGCGPGFYLRAARRRGWEAYGVDISPSFEKEEGSTIFKGTLEEAHFPSGFFNACFMSHTLNHLLNPSQTLQEMHRVLEPGGILIVVIPNFLRWGIAGLKRKWSMLVTGRHLYVFGSRTARRLICQSGFEVFNFDTRSSLLAGYLLRKYHILPESMLGHWAVRFVAKPKEFLRIFLGNFFPGPAITIWARKVL